jgi:hypothetical protein
MAGGGCRVCQSSMHTAAVCSSAWTEVEQVVEAGLDVSKGFAKPFYSALYGSQLGFQTPV